MPIAKDYEKPIVPNPPSKEPSELGKEVRINTPAYKSAVVESKYIPLGSLITHISGALWGGGVTWYSQVLGKSEEPNPFDPNLPPIYQQYRKIKTLQLKVTSPLEYQQQEDSNDPELQGVSVTLGGFIPNEGDVFLADVGSGREGIFVLNKVPQKKNILAEEVYEVSYTFVAFSDTNTKYISLLDSRTVKIEVYTPPNNGRPSYTLIDEDVVLLKKDFVELRKAVIYGFHDSFYDPARNTYLSPEGYYDGNLINFIKNIVSVRELPGMVVLDTYRLGNYFPARKDLIYKAFLTGEGSLLRNVVQKAVLLDLGGLSTNVPSTIANYNDIHYAVVPDAPQHDPSNTLVVKYTSPIWTVDETLYQSHNPTFGRPLIKPIEVDDFYILSQQFYTGQRDGMSELETIIYSGLNKQTIDTSKVNAIYNAYLELNATNRFFYGPIMIMLFNYAIASL
jgi:hypothetical protein